MDKLTVPETIPALPSPECICKTHRITLSEQRPSDEEEQKKKGEMK